MTRRLFLTAAVAAAGATASACSGGGIDAGAAAIVGDRRISVADVQTATTQINELIIDPYGENPDQRFTQQDVLGYLIQLPFVTSAAAAQGVGVSDQDAVLVFTQFKKLHQEDVASGKKRYLDPAGADAAPAQVSIDAVRTVLARNKITPQQDGSGPSEEQATKIYQGISAELQKVRIRVNPRYGTFESRFDKKNLLRVSPVTPPWLVPVAQQPAPVPAAS